MGKQYKRSFKVYSAWNYQREIEDLNRASEQGWQLVKGGCFHSVFEKNPNVQYRYQLDYRRIDNMGRYIETFREQGWEYVNSVFNGWHYFRKLYDPTQPEQAYEIFTDRESMAEMNNRWANLALGIGIVLGLFALVSLVQLIRMPNLPRLVRFLTFALESGVLLRGVGIMKNPSASRSRKGDSALVAVFFAVILLGAAGNVLLTLARPHFNTARSAAEITEPVADNRWAYFEVPYPDNYYLDLDMKAEQPMTFSVLDADGQAVYTQTGTEFTGSNVRLRLPKGSYCFSLTCDSGFSLSCDLD